ncbi:MAG: efflux RND transporter periplasmic adaptor subunit [Sphaerobacter sp.]|nr:efflux RND transporter periplasmic adaptor subunit [Sphaerobacter sp.]
MSRRRLRWIALATTGILIVAVTAAVLLTRNASPRTVAVVRGSLEATVETVGRLVPRNPVTVRSPANGQVKLVAVAVGDTVRAGDVIAELEPQPFQDAVRQAEDQVAVAEAALNLAEQQAGPNPSPEQLANRLRAEQQLRAAQSALDAARRALASTLILAPSDGTVLQVQTAAGAPIGQGAEVAQIADLAQLDLQIDLDEIDLPHVPAEAPVTFTLDAYPGQEIEGRLVRIAPLAETSGGTTTFRGTVRFTLPDGLIARPGMNADVSITTAVRNDVLLIPESALRTVGRRTFVTVLSDGREEEREIRTGLRSQGMVEVASGLAEGERVVLP